MPELLASIGQNWEVKFCQLPKNEEKQSHFKPPPEGLKAVRDLYI